METVNLICIGCPLGCPLEVEMKGAEVVSVRGNTCKNGEKYAYKELTDPTRIVTSTVRVRGGSLAMVPVKTASDIPKGKIFDCIRALQAAEVSAPVGIGDVLIEDVAATGVAIVATRNVESIQK